MDFRALASSSAGCCYVVDSWGAKAPLLIDCGVRFPLIQEALNFQVTRLAGCLISHSHGDHAKSAGALMRAGVNVYASKDAWHSIGANLAHRAKVLTPRVPTKVGDWLVHPFEAVHDIPTLGFVVSSLDERLLYLTDSAYCPYRFEGLTHIAIECNWSSEIIRDKVMSGRVDPDRYKRTVRTHMSLERLLEMLKANDLSRVREIHLLHLSSANSDAQAFHDAVAKATGVPVRVAEEGRS